MNNEGQTHKGDSETEEVKRMIDGLEGSPKSEDLERNVESNCKHGTRGQNSGSEGCNEEVFKDESENSDD